MNLTDTDRTLLAIEAKTWIYEGRKETAIREATGLSKVAATQRINHLINTREALEHDPITVQRLRRIRAGRLQTRLGAPKG